MDLTTSSLIVVMYKLLVVISVDVLTKLPLPSLTTLIGSMVLLKILVSTTEQVRLLQPTQPSRMLPMATSLLLVRLKRNYIGVCDFPIFKISLISIFKAFFFFLPRPPVIFLKQLRIKDL